MIGRKFQRLGFSAKKYYKKSFSKPNIKFHAALGNILDTQNENLSLFQIHFEPIHFYINKLVIEKLLGPIVKKNLISCRNGRTIELNSKSLRKGKFLHIAT